MKKPQKTRKATAKQSAAGRANLIAWRKRAGTPPNTKHGVHSVIASGGRELPDVPGAAKIGEEVDGIVAQMVADLGGRSEISAQQQTILEAQRLCLLVLKLAGRHLNAQGLLNKYGKPNALLGTVVSFVNAARLNSMALGLERKARKVGPSNLTEYLEQREQEKASGDAPVTQ